MKTRRDFSYFTLNCRRFGSTLTRWMKQLHYGCTLCNWCIVITSWHRIETNSNDSRRSYRSTKGHSWNWQVRRIWPVAFGLLYTATCTHHYYVWPIHAYESNMPSHTLGSREQIERLNAFVTLTVQKWQISPHRRSYVLAGKKSWKIYKSKNRKSTFLLISSLACRGGGVINLKKFSRADARELSC